MSRLTFDTLKDAWTKLKSKRSDDLRKLATSLSNPSLIHIKRISETDNTMIVNFVDLDKAVADNDPGIQQIKRVIVQWIKKFSTSVRIVSRNVDNTLTVEIDKTMRFDEAAVPIFKRDNNTNTIKKVYRCVGGKKDGRRVSDSENCMGVPDFNKKVNFGITKRIKSGQSNLGKKKTNLTSIVSKKVRKVNKNLKKARGI